MRIELVRRTIERRITTLARIGTFRLVVQVLAGERCFGPFVDDYLFFVRCEIIIFRFFHGFILRTYQAQGHKTHDQGQRKRAGDQSPPDAVSHS